VSHDGATGDEARHNRTAPVALMASTPLISGLSRVGGVMTGEPLEPPGNHPQVAS
jgi:hypothetical protein